MTAIRSSSSSPRDSPPPQADTTDLEAQIDRLVYQLYNLTPDEIALIEQ
jgi:hypothetical protein